MQYSKIVEHLRTSRAKFTWVLDSENTLRGTLKVPPPNSSTTPGLRPSSSESLAKPVTPMPLLTPITALCLMLTGKQYKSTEYAYAATELDIDLRVARAIELASDDVNCNSDGMMLLNVLNPLRLTTR